MSARIWHSTRTAADHAGCHPDTVLKACESGELHANQRKKKGRWRINVGCLDAWCAGDPCGHQSTEVAS